MVINIEDRFTIDFNTIKKTYPSIKVCKFPNKTYTVIGFTKSGLSVYFTSDSININCKCQYCYNSETGKAPKIGCILKNQITIVETKLQKDRDSKLNKILNIA